MSSPIHLDSVVIIPYYDSMDERSMIAGEEYAERGDIEGLNEIVKRLSRDRSSNEYLYLSAYLRFLRGELSDALSLCEKCKSSHSTREEMRLFCKIALLKSTILRRLGEYVDSNRVLDRCFAIRKHGGFMLGTIWNSKGVNYWMLGKFTKAKHCYKKARYLAKRQKEMSLFLKSSINLGIVPLHQGDFFEAHVYLRNALELCEREKKKRLQIYAILNLGELYVKQGDWVTAKALMSHCSQLAIESGLSYEEGASYWIRGNIYRDEHNFEEACRLYHKSLLLLDKSLSHTEKLYVYLNQGILERMRGQYQKSLRLLGRAQSIMDETGEKLDEGYLLIEMGFVYWWLDEKQLAIRCLKRGIAKTHDMRYEHTIGNFFLHYINKQRHHLDDPRFDKIMRTCWKHGYDSVLARERHLLLPMLCEYILKRRRSILSKMVLLRLVNKYEVLIGFLLNNESARCQEVALMLIDKLQLETFRKEVKKKIWDLRPRVAKQAVTTLEKLEQQPVPSLMVRFFGKFEVIKDGHLYIEFTRRQVGNLFKLLVLHYKKVFLNEQLMEIFWPGASPATSHNSLRQVIFLLRKTFSEHGFDAGEIIHRDTGYYTFRYPHQRLRVDFFEFKETIEQADILWASKKLPSARAAYETAFALYKGTMLVENLYDGWSETYRLEARDMFTRCVSHLVTIYDQNAPEKAGGILSKAKLIEPGFCCSSHTV
jgi:tetratricopeptide (TPR) repeat protein